MSLLDFLSPALTVGTEAAGAQQQAQLQSSLMKRQQEIQALLMQRQFQMQDAQIHHLGAQDTHIGNEDNPAVQGGLAGARAAATGEKAKNEADVTHLGNEDNPQVQGQLAGARATAEVGPHVQEKVQSFNQTLPGQEHLARIRAMANPMAQTQLSRLSQASGMAQDADKGMRTYEQKVLGGQAQFGPGDIAAAKIMMGGGSIASTAAETALNAKNPDLAEYVRNAKAMATAERMISQRGGSNALTGAEQLLSGAAQGGAGPNLIRQAQQFRARIIQSLDRDGSLNDAGISPSLDWNKGASKISGLGGFSGLPDRK